jgi:hypothetical protein
MARLTGLFAGAAFALSAGAAGAAFAQAAPPRDAAFVIAQADRDAAAAAPSGKAAEPGVRREERRIVIQRGDDRREYRFADDGHHMDMAEHLRTMLQLKPGQEPALQAYVAALRPAPRPEGGSPAPVASRDSDHPKTTPERLADMEKRLADQQARSHARIEATRRFYAQLEPSQKKVFDEMPMMMGPGLGMDGMMMMHGPMKIRFAHPPMPPMPPTPPMPPAPPPPPRL